MYTVYYGVGFVSIVFNKREPMTFRDKEEVTGLIISLCNVLHRAWPEQPKSVTKDK